MDCTIYNLTFVSSSPPHFDENTLFVERIADDTVGTTFGATWVYVLDKEHNKKIALFKPFDYDEPLSAYTELLYSHLASLVFDGIQIRIPKIHLVRYQNELGLLSYSIVENTPEDLIHMESIMFHKYERHELKQFYTLGIDDIFSCINCEVFDSQNFVSIKEAVIHTLLLDAFTNNVDRHGKNWGLVRNKATNYYELSTFDNAKSFVNMIFNRPGYSDKDLWSIVYNGTTSTSKIETGKSICLLIKEKYPKEFDDFILRLNTNFDTFISSLRPLSAINSRRIATHLKDKIHHFKHIEV